MNTLAFHATSASHGVQGRIAPVLPTTGIPDPIQLHADAHNSLSMALHYLRQPQVNLPGARRKAIQALTALHSLNQMLNKQGGAA